MNSFGNFGNISGNYTKGRKSYPPEVFDYLWSLLNLNNPSILDLGCGTGIATRQLFENGALTYGADGDSKMIDEAKKLSSKEIIYKVSPAEKIPFENELFNAVTAFQAFRWFANKEAVSEIARVLNPGGVLFIVNRNDRSNIIDQFHNLLREKYIVNEDRVLPKHFERHQELLENAGFKLLPTKEIPSVNYFTLPEVIAYCQSSSLWNKVPDNRKGEASNELEDLFSKLLIDGKIKQDSISVCDPSIKIISSSGV